MLTQSKERDAPATAIRGGLQVVDLARSTGVTPATIRYYARIGLLSPERDEQNGYRRFTHADRQRVLFVRRCQALGLTLTQSRDILKRLDRGEDVAAAVADFVRLQLEVLRRQSVELDRQARWMECALSRWGDQPARRVCDLDGLIGYVEVVERYDSDGTHRRHEV